MLKMLRKPSVTLAALRGPNPWRVAVDGGLLVVRLDTANHGRDVQWDFVAFLRYNPLRPVLLRIQETFVSPTHRWAGLEPAEEYSVLHPCDVRCDGRVLYERGAFRAYPNTHVAYFSVSRDSESHHCTTEQNLSC